jgi:uncharacterized membrane protein
MSSSDDARSDTRGLDLSEATVASTRERGIALDPRRAASVRRLVERFPILRPILGVGGLKWRDDLPMLVLMCAYVGWFSYLSMKVYYGFGYPPFDLAIFDQGMWLLSHFHASFVSVIGRDLFGDHTSFILLPLVPFYRLVPEPQGLLILQTMFLGVTAIPIYRLARKLIGSVAIANLLAASYLLNPALQKFNLDQFHPEAFQVLIITLAIYAAVESRFVLLTVMVVLALMVKEDAAVLVIALGVWVLWRRNRTWGLRIIGASAGWAVLANLIIIPGVLGYRGFYVNRIPFGGVSGTLHTVLHAPGQLVAYLRADARPFYVWQLGFMNGWGFLLSPEIAAISLLVIAENVLSTNSFMHQIPFQYTVELVVSAGIIPHLDAKSPE